MLLDLQLCRYYDFAKENLVLLMYLVLASINLKHEIATNGQLNKILSLMQDAFSKLDDIFA